MRILLVTRNVPTKTVVPVDRGGGTDTFMESVVALPSSFDDIEIDVVSLSPEGVPIDPPRGVGIRCIPIDRLHNFLWKHREARNPFVALAILLVTGSMLGFGALSSARRKKYDLVYSVGGPIAGLAGIVVKRVFGLPLAMHFHYTYNHRKASLPVRFLARTFYRQTDALIGNCAMLGEDAVAIGMPPERCFEVRNWVDTSLFRPVEDRTTYRERLGISPEQTVFFFGGRFCPTKQVDRLIEALRGYKNDRAVFLFAGQGVLGDQIDALARENSNIRTLGTVARRDLPALHAAADVQLWGSVDVDYPGLVVMEAMASGLPVFTSDETMNSLYAGEKVRGDFLGQPKYARLFPPTRDGIRQAIAEAIERRDELNAMRKEISAFASRSFGSQNQATLVSILRETARSRNAGPTGASQRAIRIEPQ